MSAPPVKESLNLESIGNLVRYWVHYDNTINDINKRVRNLRDMKATYETHILQMLQSSNMKDPVIQIADGRLIIGEDKTSQPLSFTMLEAMLNRYYASKPGSRPETKEILKYIRDNRTTQVAPCLKRISTNKARTRDADKKV